jgi:hypothetical protein
MVYPSKLHAVKSKKVEFRAIEDLCDIR